MKQQTPWAVPLRNRPKTVGVERVQEPWTKRRRRDRPLCETHGHRRPGLGMRHAVQPAPGKGAGRSSHHETT